MTPRSLLVVGIALASCIDSARATAAVLPVYSPAEIEDSVGINFDGYPDETVANSLLQEQGVEFSRDDGAAIAISDWSALDRSTTSPRNVLATISFAGTLRYSTHLNATFSSPVLAVGAYFGNDQYLPDFSYLRLSAYGASGELLGSADFPVNDNLSVDQFAGLRSDVPIQRLRFENFAANAEPSLGLSVVLDDLVFALVPEPVRAGLFLLLLAALGATRRARSRKLLTVLHR